jgi:hypothetical protein
MKSLPKNVPASVRARLLKLSRDREEDFSLTLSRFASERFLYRLGKSEHRQKYVLKGAMLLTSILDDIRYRPTRDIDVLREGTGEKDSIITDISAVCSIDDLSDGLVFDISKATFEDIRENNRYHGMRAKIPVRLGDARIPLQIDIGFGDAVYPPPQTVKVEPLLDHEAPEVFAYPLPAVVAEKLEAIVSIGMVTSRMKDFFDLYTIASSRRFDRQDLFESIRVTFSRRGTPLPMEVPTVLSKAMPKDPAKQAQWAAFVRRIEREPSELPLDAVVSRIREFTRVIWDSSLYADITTWKPGEGWC